MADIILGMADTSSFANVAEVAEREVSRRQGAARKIIMNSDHVEIAVFRPEIDQSFANVSMRIKAFETVGKDNLEKALADFQGKYDLQTDGSYATVTYPADGVDAQDGVAMEFLR